MNKVVYLILSVLLALTIQRTYAQQVLALENVDRFKRVTYYPGDFIRFRMNDSKAKFSGRIESVNDSMMVLLRSQKMENKGDATNQLYRDYVRISDISHVYKRPTDSYGEFFLDMMAGGLIGAGVMFVVGLPIDAALAGEQLDPTSFAIGAGMLVTGTLLVIFRKKKYRVNNNWRLRVMNSFIEGVPAPQQEPR